MEDEGLVRTRLEAEHGPNSEHLSHQSGFNQSSDAIKKGWDIIIDSRALLLCESEGRVGGNWMPQLHRATATPALKSGIIWLQFCAFRGSREASAIFIYISGLTGSQEVGFESY